jgi:hypothetical protein
MSQHHHHAVVWIDHHEARVFHFSPTDVERLILHPDHRPSTSITRQILSGAGTPRRITTTFTPSLNQLQTRVRFSSQDQPMQRPNWSNTFTTTIQN